MLIFEWDPAKARENEQKHGVSFSAATEVFGDDHSSTVPDPEHSRDEARYLIWHVKCRQNPVVSYTERAERMRLI
jgi:uncharacterized protein